MNIVRGAVAVAFLVLMALYAIVAYTSIGEVCIGGATIESGSPVVTLETVCSGDRTTP